MKELKQPTSVRWNIERLDFIRHKESLSSIQEVFTFLIDKYWWESKSDIMKEQKGAMLDHIPHPAPITPSMGQFEAFKNEIDNAMTVYSCETISKEIWADNSLTQPQKMYLVNLCKIKSQEIDF